MLNVYQPASENFESRLPNSDELGPFMDRLMRIVKGVTEKVSFGYELHWNVWFINRTDSVVCANLHVDAVDRAPSRTAIQRSLDIENHEISVANAEGGVSAVLTDKNVVEQINGIVQQLEKSLKA